MRSLSPTAFSFTLAQAFSNFLLTLSPTAFLCTLVYIVSHNVYARSCILCPTADHLPANANTYINTESVDSVLKPERILNNPAIAVSVQGEGAGAVAGDGAGALSPS